MNLEERHERVNKRYLEIKITAERIKSLLNENMVLFNMQDNQSSEIWLSYVAFIDNLIKDSLFKSIACRYANTSLFWNNSVYYSIIQYI